MEDIFYDQPMSRVFFLLNINLQSSPHSFYLPPIKSVASSGVWVVMIEKRKATVCVNIPPLPLSIIFLSIYTHSNLSGLHIPSFSFFLFFFLFDIPISHYHPFHSLNKHLFFFSFFFICLHVPTNTWQPGLTFFFSQFIFFIHTYIDFE